MRSKGADVFAGSGGIIKFQFLVSAIKQGMLAFRRQVLKWRIQTLAKMLDHTAGNGNVPAVLQLFSPGRHSAFVERFCPVRNHKIRIDFHARAQAVARRTGTIRSVERKHPGRQFLVRYATIDTGKMLAEYEFSVVHHIHQHNTRCQIQRRFNRICQSGRKIGFDHQPVDDNFDIVFFVLVQDNL